VRNYGPWLWGLAALFIVRVVAQPLALVANWGFLPRFESWHSGLMPYPLLVGTQLLILAWLLTTARRVSRATVQPSRTLGRFLLGISGIYAVTMLMRLALGATVLRDERWFASLVPTVFHLVLAGYLLAYGHLHYRYG
jgi:hypothetical protein